MMIKLMENKNKIWGNTEKNKYNKENIVKFAPIMGLVIVTVVFAILTNGKTITTMNLNLLTNQMIITALVSLGAVFSFSCGALDMSLGGSLCLSAIAGGLVGIKTESSLWMIITVFAVSIAIALFKGYVAAYLTLPVFIVTIIFSGVLSAIGLVLLGETTTVSVGSIVSIKNMVPINIGVIVVFYIISLVLFNYTKIGKSFKLQGGNPLAAGQLGINARKNIIIAFLISGIGIALAATITLLRTKTVTAATGGSIGMDIMVAIVLGGMPLSGGPRSKISAAIVGAATITVLNNGLSVYGVSTGAIQIIRGIIFLVVVYITSMNYRTKLLPR